MSAQPGTFVPEFNSFFTSVFATSGSGTRKDADEYRRRVEFLYDFLEKQGVPIDKQNRNPSRLSRMPGVTRNGNRQYLVDTKQTLVAMGYPEYFRFLFDPEEQKSQKN